METGRSSMFQAGSILLLIGAIMSAVGALLLLLATLWIGAFFSRVGAPATNFVVILYGILGALTGMGAAFSFVAFNKSRQGDARGAWILGLVGSLLPPLQVLILVGAILCKVSEEGQMQRA